MTDSNGRERSRWREGEPRGQPTEALPRALGLPLGKQLPSEGTSAKELLLGYHKSETAVFPVAV